MDTEPRGGGGSAQVSDSPPAPISSRLPEPFFDLPTAAQMLGTTEIGLRSYLIRYRAHLEPARYRFTRTSRRYRMLSSPDLRALQALTIRRTRRLSASA